ncbi:MAG: hypothetical protein FWF38_08640, partial [Spirochaetaceae bacterium]|nr:hypothetical protein [Spirochaetaceae bacterium]
MISYKQGHHRDAVEHSCAAAPRFHKYILPLIILLLFFIPSSLFSVDIYWDAQKVIVPSNGRFHTTAFVGGTTAIVWHEFVKHDENRGVVFLSIATTADGIEWVRNERFAGPFNYAGDEVAICSLAVKSNGDIYIA